MTHPVIEFLPSADRKDGTLGCYADTFAHKDVLKAAGFKFDGQFWVFTAPIQTALHMCATVLERGWDLRTYGTQKRPISAEMVATLRAKLAA